MFQTEISVEQDVLLATSNAQRPWATMTYQLNFTPGQSSYAINVTNFGKPILVTKIINSPYIKRVNVPYDDFGNQHYGTVLNAFNNTYGIPWDIEETPERMSFFRTQVLNSECRVTIEPQPQWSGVYEITYVPGYIGDSDPLEAAIQMPEHAEYLRTRCALRLLPYCKWSDDKAANMEQKAELKELFIEVINEKKPLFDKFITSITIPRDVMVSDWNSAY